MAKFFSNEKDIILETFVEPHVMFFHGYECLMDDTIRHAIHDLKEVDSLANHSLSTSSDKF